MAPLEAPPAYELPAYSEVKPVGIPVQLQLDGRTVSATLIQEVIYTGAPFCVWVNNPFPFQPQGKQLVFLGDGDGGGGGGGGVSAQGPRPPPPKDYLGLALLGLLCCCFPLGIVALFRSIEVRVYTYNTNTKFPRG